MGLETIQLSAQPIAFLGLARLLALLAFQLALLELQVFIGNFDESLALFLLDVNDVAGQTIDVLDAQRSLQRGLQAHFRMVVGGNLLNLFAIEEEELRDAGRDGGTNKVLPDFLVLHRHALPSRTTTSRSVRSRGFGLFHCTGRP